MITRSIGRPPVQPGPLQRERDDLLGGVPAELERARHDLLERARQFGTRAPAHRQADLNLAAHALSSSSVGWIREY
ncbi:hypothetical protein AB0L53_22325 [Nonomuraea sp. NPDC052129]|uniref:hypothetical protein n=1 Tax=Nonomuraea sp. NPDC052129 TaxID=3154651 RepID=UPI003446E774